MNIAISVSDLEKTFRDERVLKNINHDFEAGKIHGIIGNNGSGKTVLMKCICGFLRPTSGKVLVNYEQIGKDVDFPSDMGLIIERPGFLLQYSGIKNLELLARLNKRIGLKEITETMEKVGLEPELKRTVKKYSLGMRQKLGIAQAIMENPSILILDEPFNALDKNSVIDIRNILKGLRDSGKTILLTSHNPQDIDELCDTVCEMDMGELNVVKG